jgi:hypothetical protein
LEELNTYLFRNGKGYDRGKNTEERGVSMGPLLFRNGKRCCISPRAGAGSGVSMGPLLFRNGKNKKIVLMFKLYSRFQWGHFFSEP